MASFCSRRQPAPYATLLLTTSYITERWLRLDTHNTDKEPGVALRNRLVFHAKAQLRMGGILPGDCLL